MSHKPIHLPVSIRGKITNGINQVVVFEGVVATRTVKAEQDLVIGAGFFPFLNKEFTLLVLS